jgi:hypothetical protein
MRDDGCYAEYHIFNTLFDYPFDYPFDSISTSKRERERERLLTVSSVRLVVVRTHPFAANSE